MNNDLNEEIALLAGKLHAIGFAVAALIATHPNKRYLREVWDNVLPERIDEWMSEAAYANPALRDEMHRHLASMRELLDVETGGDDEAD